MCTERNGGELPLRRVLPHKTLEVLVEQVFRKKCGQGYTIVYPEAPRRDLLVGEDAPPRDVSRYFGIGRYVRPIDSSPQLWLNLYCLDHIQEISLSIRMKPEEKEHGKSDA